MAYKRTYKLACADPPHGLKPCDMYQRPVVPLRKALYGHPKAGAFWECECNERLQSLVYVPVEEWPSCFMHPENRILVIVYVDNFTLVGPSHMPKQAWD